jgi:hypothetical protein
MQEAPRRRRRKSLMRVYGRCQRKAAVLSSLVSSAMNPLLSRPRCPSRGNEETHGRSPGRDGAGVTIARALPLRAGALSVVIGREIPGESQVQRLTVPGNRYESGVGANKVPLVLACRRGRRREDHRSMSHLYLHAVGAPGLPIIAGRGDDRRADILVINMTWRWTAYR